MRLWSLHPRYLDAQGLVALWREALLAQAVLRGKTRGYKHHPHAYLAQVHVEATARGYSFDATKIGPRRRVASIPVATGQLGYEWTHLLRKLRKRSPDVYRKWHETRTIGIHPLFRRVVGPIAHWEKIS
jgi:Pyrimidine dimer DNA glycosylase